MNNHTPATAQQSSAWEDLLEVLWAPSKVFERTRTRGVGIYLLLLTGVFVVLVLATKNLLQPYVDANYDLQVIKMAEQGQKMPAEAVEQGRTFSGYFLLFSWSLTAIFSGLLGGLVTWLGAKVVGAALPLGRAVFIATLASVPRVLSLLATAAQGALVDASAVTSLFSASLGPARFMDPVKTNPGLLGVLASLDPFTLWNVLITAVGVSVFARVSRGAGWMASLVALGITLLFTLIPAVLA
ncbi:YIP1 family protein [Gemmatimonas sp.]|jgi:hypothetical protein|uniref:YIP1 family protein n=1 Tax=Gemmatimonas sp. TaxID=1962908 RepID=UPI0037C0D7DD